MRTALVLVSLLVGSVFGAPALAAPSVFDKSGISDWKTQPTPGKEPTFKPPSAVRSKLKNGMQLLVVENHKLPIVSLALVVPGAGTAADPKGKGGLAAFTADLLDEGAGGLSPIAIAEETDRLGAGIAIAADADAAYMSISTLAKTLDSTLELATKLITQPAFEDKEAERVKGDRITSLELRRDRPREVAANLVNGAIYGPSSAYGHPGAGVLGEFKAVTTADARAFYKERWNPAVMTLVVVGDVDPKALRAKLDAGLGAWKPAGVKRPAKVAAAPAKIASRLLLVDRPAAAQSDVRFGLIGLDRKDPRFFAFEVYRTTLGDGFTSRLVQRLREQLGITYGANASMDWRIARGPFVIGTAIVTAATGQGISETLKMVEELTTTDVPAAELEKSKQNLIRALPARFETNAGTAGALAELALQGLPVDWYARYADGIRKVTAKELKTVAKSVVPAKSLVVAIVGDMSKIRADVDKLGLGDPAMFDLYGVALKK
ncbi:MAG: insulinase family protein [Deltaproteobacteria bacterium]|nr:insulinase family protein [Deltaproteobacteria bacterium]